jgi:2-polyprenyl-3-methyl-5-hydroxy-6-metoxy-1,4-benzoquinol methylase
VTDDPVARKYDALASTYSGRYADPAAIARRQVDLVYRWGQRPGGRPRVLEIGCADGFVTEALVRRGAHVTAVDLSPSMVERTTSRLGAAGLSAEVFVADVNSFEPTRSYDVVVAMMWSFFSYVHDPMAVLSRLAGAASSKVLVDANPRRHPVTEAIGAMRSSGFVDVRWRPFFVPQRRRLSRPSQAGLSVAELVPGLRSLPLRWRFEVVLCGRPS